LLFGIGKRIKKKIKQEDTTQEEVARDVKVSKSHLHEVKQERERPSVRLLARLAKRLDTTVDYFVRGRRKK